MIQIFWVTVFLCLINFFQNSKPAFVIALRSGAHRWATVTMHKSFVQCSGPSEAAEALLLSQRVGRAAAESLNEPRSIATPIYWGITQIIKITLTIYLKLRSSCNRALVAITSKQPKAFNQRKAKSSTRK